MPLKINVAVKVRKRSNFYLSNKVIIIRSKAIKIEGELLSDLFRAINSFASTQFGLILSEIGLFNQRLFYKNVDSEIYLFLVNDLIHFSKSVLETQNLVNSMIDRLIDELKQTLIFENPGKDKDIEDLYKNLLDFDI